MVSNITFAHSMLYQSNLYQNTVGLQHYPPMDKMSQVSFKLKFFSKLNWLFYYLLITLTIQLNTDDKSGIRASGSMVYHKTIRLIRTRSRCARVYARKLSIAIWSINYDWQTQGALIKSARWFPHQPPCKVYTQIRSPQSHTLIFGL